jgi:hypothetical protein
MTMRFHLPLSLLIMLALLTAPASRAVADPSAQIFVDISAALTAVRDSAVAWGDFDNDGDPDLVITGDTGAGRTSTLYRNQRTGAFSVVNANLIGVSHGAVAWGDFNNDGQLDLALCGESATGAVTQIYRNDGGTFTPITSTLPGVSDCSLAWGDVDNDGRSDLLITGNSATGAITKIYRNTIGGFIDNGANLIGVSHGRAAWGDFNNDGNLDVALMGQTADGVGIARVYRNDRGVLSDLNAGLSALRDGTLVWGDYDNDGDPDLVLTGFNGFIPTTKIYRNDNGIFMDINAGLTTGNNLWANAAWGDFDNDGRLDLALSSQTETKVYHTDGGGAFTDLQDLPATSFGSFAWGDYDVDRRLDFLLTGQSGRDVYTRQYRNTTPISNTAPTAPISLTATTTSHAVRLTWGAGGDMETPAAGLTYNLRVGTTPGGSDVIAPLSIGASGYRQVPQSGNRDHAHAVTLNLEAGVYYWSVQSIDTGFVGSPFATEGTFRIWPHNIALPLVLNNYATYFEGPWEVEPNNVSAQANGPLRSGQAYLGYPNDNWDAFTFIAPTAGMMSVDLSNFIDPNGQLQIYYQSLTDPHFVYDSTPPFHVDYVSGQPGLYYVFIYANSGFNTTTPYTLTVSYP